MIESQRCEFKSEYTDNILKTVVAFANSEGGKVLIGVDDNGKTIGLKDIDESYTRVINSIRDNISPDITMFIKY